MSLVKTLNMKQGALYEVIVTTMDVNHQPHAAPMGVRVLKENLFSMRSYGETKTLNNLKATRHGFLNIVHDVEPFFYCLFKPSQLSFDWIMEFPRLKRAFAWIYFKVHDVIEKEGYYEIMCSALDAHIKRVRARPRCRAESSLLEALIHYTRIKYYESIKRKDKIAELRSLIYHHLDIVERTGWPKLKRMAEELKQKIS
ncbi:MAG: DUF447 domain-containing protein [Candidatus Nezhaarchaeales archaeon]